MKNSIPSTEDIPNPKETNKGETEKPKKGRTQIDTLRFSRVIKKRQVQKEKKNGIRAKRF